MPAWMRHAADFPEFAGIGPGDTVVDVGCGPDALACASACRLGAEAIAIDVAPDLLRLAEHAMRSVPSARFRAILSDCDPVPLPDGTADLVICTEVLEHVPDPARLMAELARIGKPGACYILSVPDAASEGLMRVAAHPDYFRAPGHLRVFSRDDFDRLVRSAGLEVERRPPQPNNAFWAVHCLLRAALDPNGLAPGSPAAELPALGDWHRVWSALAESPKADAVIPALDALLPRSQALIARKPGGVPHPPPRDSAADGPGADPPPRAGLRLDRGRDALGAGPIGRLSSRAKDALRGGTLRLGPMELRWNLSRRPGPAG